MCSCFPAVLSDSGFAGRSSNPTPLITGESCRRSCLPTSPRSPAWAPPSGCRCGCSCGCGRGPGSRPRHATQEPLAFPLPVELAPKERLPSSLSEHHSSRGSCWPSFQRPRPALCPHSLASCTLCAAVTASSQLSSPSSADSSCARVPRPPHVLLSALLLPPSLPRQHTRRSGPPSAPHYSTLPLDV